MLLFYLLSQFLYILSFYSCVIPFLLVSWFLLKTKRPALMDWFAIANGWCGAGNLLWLAAFGVELFYAWYAQNVYEGYSFYYSRTTFFSPYNFLFWVRILLLATTILFLVTRLRRSIWFTAIIVSGLFLTDERLVLYIVSFYRDYLPSSRARRPSVWWESDIFSFLFYLLLLTGTYLVQQKRRQVLPTHNS